MYFQIGKFALGAAIGLSLILIGFVLMNNGGHDDSPPTAMSVLSAMQVTIDAYQCHRSENKHIMWGEHGRRISMSGENRMPAELENQFREVAFIGGFELPQIASGLIVFHLNAPMADTNLQVIVGGRAWNDNSASADERTNVQLEINNLTDQAVWSTNGGVYSARLDDIRLQISSYQSVGGDRGAGGGEEISSLLNHLTRSDSDGIVDVIMSGGPRANAFAIVACEPPRRGHGMTMSVMDPPIGIPVGAMRIFCHTYRADAPPCQPFIGDTPCATELPLMCIQDLNISAPEGSEFELFQSFWSSGEAAATLPVRGSQFETIGDADAHCQATFGSGWRTANYHEGGRQGIFTAMGSVDDPSSRFWVDIKDQPYATCWAR